MPSNSGSRICEKNAKIHGEKKESIVIEYRIMDNFRQKSYTRYKKLFLYLLRHVSTPLSNLAIVFFLNSTFLQWQNLEREKNAI